ncbi:YkvA family protein [Pedobacter sp. MW01-1-1]|uniref:YkvA family protein n=1 Tax=Pedobacter sp. MW01-1-1 TaxID=3383027 RepID=UPI003FED9483
MKINRQKIKEYFKKSQQHADGLLKDRGKAMETVKEAFGKAVTNKGQLELVWDKMLLLFGVAKDYMSGDYTQIPKRSIVAILGGLIYFLSPVDVIPDFVLVFGFIDDVFILNLVYKQASKDLEQYKAWKDAQTQKVIGIDI